MPGFSLEDIQKQAQVEIAQESFRAAVELRKQIIREAMKRKRWWHSIFPYTISFNMERLPDV